MDHIFRTTISALVFSSLLTIGTVHASDALRMQVSDSIAKGDIKSAEGLLDAAANEIVAGSVFFEELTQCGFYPQETRLECALNIKQMGGYGGPVGGIGSIEHVLFCVDWNQDGLFSQSEIVGSGTVHVHDESNNTQPPWQYAVYRDFDPLGRYRTLNDLGLADTKTAAPTRTALAVLSWFIAPSSCNFNPVWGNAVKFRIRFSPIR